MRNALFLLAPFCGWLSDTKIGRVSLSLLYTNILPYGIDQLMNESSVKIRAFIHWFWLCLYSGYALPIIIADELTISVAALALFSFSLCLHFFLKHRFEHIPIPNPYKIVFKVLKFSLTTSRTRRQHRSAFTYWGEEPSRMDLAKERYGGCFSHEEVENFKDGYERSAKNAIWLLGNLTSWLVVVPLFELVILPLFPKLEYFIINPLKGLGLANILILLSIVSLFLIDLIGRIASSITSEMPCFFMWKSVNQTIDISYRILLIPSVLAGTSYFLTWIYSFEFLCSQSPFGMHGMITGLFWFLHTRWYVNRVRDTDLDLRAAVEEHWEHMLIEEDNTNNDIETEYFVISSYM
uniref:Uncharacterized protein n=1 Tax=Amphimedon queenslandica TaxID=400682 RepID=A0A1X7TIN9_AMPQE